MAIDSIIANPTKRVLVIVDEVSGCCAIEVIAATIALPSLIEGAIHPSAVVSPAIMMDTMEIRVILSISFFIRFIFLFTFCFRSSSNVNGSQHPKYIGLYHTCKQTKYGHKHWKQ